MIAFQRQIDGDVNLCVLDLESGEIATIVHGPGHALHPCWSPDGETIAYAFAHFTHTAAEGIEHGYNLFTVPAAGGEPTRLTDGLCRDYTPTFTPEGDEIVFSSTRGLETSGATLMRIPADGGAPTDLDLPRGRDVGFVEPAFSPDGSLICCSHIRSYRDNWTLQLLRADDPTNQFTLTDGADALYAPVWSPDGTVIACTGYATGDPGWGLYLVEAATGLAQRLDVGPGNCRSPVWTPEGDRLIFESNREGTYDLFSVEISQLEFGTVPPFPHDAAVLSLEPASDEETVRDGSDSGNELEVSGEPSIDAEGVRFGPGDSIAARRPQGLDFGEGAFAVRAEITLREVTGEVQIIAVGDYPQHSQGWQLYISDEGHLYFNSRTAEGTFVGARSDHLLTPGTRLSVVGLRRAGGHVELWIDGVRQHRSGTGADMRYEPATQVRICSQYSGGWDFAGTLHSLSILSQAPAARTIRRPYLEEFVRQ
jgi:hypothetical protein